MAYRELISLGSNVRIPVIYYAYTHESMTFIVMEYIPGKTAMQLLCDDDEARKEDIYSKVAMALGELHRIPIKSGSRLAAFDGGKICHSMFDGDEGNEAPIQYRDTNQLETHLNLVGAYLLEPRTIAYSLY